MGQFKWMGLASRSMVIVVALAAFLLNPHLGCGGSEDADFQYSGKDLEKAIAGLWFVRSEAASTVLSIEAAPAPPTTAFGQGVMKRAHACNNRQLYRSAAACASASILALTANYRDPSEVTRKAAGTFKVYSLLFTQGHLELELFNGDRLSGDYNTETPDAFEGTLWRANGPAERVSFERTQPLP